MESRDGITWEQLGIKPGLTSIVILTLNELQHTRRCVESVVANTPERHELIFVDNGSTDGTLEYLRGLDRAVVVSNVRNLGFGGGCNQGISIASGDRVLLLNNDTVVTPGWLDAMHAAMDADPSIGIVGPRSNCVAGVQHVESVDYDVATLDGLADFARRWSAANRGSAPSVPRVIGFCMLVDRAVVDAVGGFDLRYGIGNFEDDDLCLRARIAGFDIGMADDSFVHHSGSRTFAGTRTDYRATLAANWRRFANRWSIRSAMPGVATTYDADAILRRTPFEPSEHYAPLVATPRDGRRAQVERRSLALMVPADAADVGSFESVVRRAMQVHCDDPWMTIVVRLDVHAGELLGAALERAANAVVGELPDIVVVTDDGLNDEALVDACDAVLCHGRRAAAYDGLASYLGRITVIVGSPPDDGMGNVTQLRAVA